MLWLEYGWKGRDVWSEIWEVSRRPRFDSWVRKIHWRRYWLPTPIFLGIPGGSAGKESTCSAGDLGSVPGSGISLGEGNGNPFQNSCLENSTSPFKTCWILEKWDSRKRQASVSLITLFILCFLTYLKYFLRATVTWEQQPPHGPNNTSLSVPLYCAYLVIYNDKYVLTSNLQGQLYMQPVFE